MRRSLTTKSLFDLGRVPPAPATNGVGSGRGVTNLLSDWWFHFRPQRGLLGVHTWEVLEQL